MKVVTNVSQMLAGKGLLVIPLLKNMNDVAVDGGKGGGEGEGGRGGRGLGGDGGGDFGGEGGVGKHVCVSNWTVAGGPPQGGDKPYRISEAALQYLPSSFWSSNDPNAMLALMYKVLA